MAATTKYQPAPQRDSLDDAEYSRAPPSYQEAQPGDIREEGDAIPEDFKFGGSVAEASISIRQQFIRKVYFILLCQVLLTTGLSAVSFYSASYKNWIQSNPWMMWVSLLGSIGFLLGTFAVRKSYPTNLILLTAFTAFEAYSISVITSFYDAKLVLEALIITAGIFVFLTAFACQTKYDFTSWIPYAGMVLWTVVLGSLMYAFFPHTQTSELVYGLIIAIVFSIYILIDTQMVIRHYHVEEEIAAAIALYLDILNLFLAILRILNSQQNN